MSFFDNLAKFFGGNPGGPGAALPGAVVPGMASPVNRQLQPFFLPGQSLYAPADPNSMRGRVGAGLESLGQSISSVSQGSSSPAYPGYPSAELYNRAGAGTVSLIRQILMSRLKQNQGSPIQVDSQTIEPNPYSGAKVGP